MRDDPIPFIIETLRLPVLRARADRPGEGVDLALYEPALRALLHEAEEVYEAALDEWRTRRDPNKPERRLEDNWDPDEEAPYDYREDTGAGLEDWEEHWRRFYHRGRGNPGASRTRSGELSVEPLHALYLMVRRWWLDTVGTPFSPSYPRKHEGDARTHYEYFNPAGRLFLLIAQELDPRYTARICYGVHETVRKKPGE